MHNIYNTDYSACVWWAFDTHSWLSLCTLKYIYLNSVLLEKTVILLFM